MTDQDDADAAAAAAQVDAYFENVQEAKRDEEKTRDQAILLVVGGALTLSFQLVSSIYERRELTSVEFLTAAWIAWAVALLATLLNYSMSIHAHEYVMNRLLAEEYDRDKLEPWYSKWIPRVNYFVIASTIIGFILFGVFAIQNLSVPRESAAEQAKEVPLGKEEVGPATGGGVSAAVKDPATAGENVGPKSVLPREDSSTPSGGEVGPGRGKESN